MADSADKIKNIVMRYINKLKEENISVSEVILFGSYAKGAIRDESDIDIAIISDYFSGDRFKDRRKIVPLRRGIDSRIEPIPFRQDAFQKGGILADEIKKTGIKLI